MNKVVLIGRLTKEPELKYTPGNGTAVVNVNLAVDRYNPSTQQKEADFISIVIWGKQAENLATYCGKGSQIAVAGRIQTRSYEAKDGSKRYITEVVVQEVKFLNTNVNANTDTNNNVNNYNCASDDITPVDDKDIPF